MLLGNIALDLGLVLFFIYGLVVGWRGGFLDRLKNGSITALAGIVAVVALLLTSSGKIAAIVGVIAKGGSKIVGLFIDKDDADPEGISHIVGVVISLITTAALAWAVVEAAVYIDARMDLDFFDINTTWIGKLFHDALPFSKVRSLFSF